MIRSISQNKEVSDRVFYCLSCFDKIDTEKLSLDSRFDKDLGLDSLDNGRKITLIDENYGEIQAI